MIARLPPSYPYLKVMRRGGGIGMLPGLGVAFVLVILLQAGFITWQQGPAHDAVEFTLNLIFECHGDVDASYQLSYGWMATGFEATGATAQLTWRALEAVAVGATANPVHQAIQAAFSEIGILSDALQAYPGGSWSLGISSRVQQHVTLGIQAQGFNDTIAYVDAYADLSLVPESLKTALSGFGIDTVDVKAQILLRMKGSLLAQYFSNVGLVIGIYVDLIKQTGAIFLGMIRIANA